MVGVAVVGDDAEGLDAEERLLPAGGAAHEQLEGAVGDLEVVALVLEALQLVDDLVHLGAVEGETKLLGFEEDRRAAGELGHDEAGAVADPVRVDVLVRVGPLGDRAHVQARLVGERRPAYVGRLGVQRHVHELGDVMGDGSEPLEAVPGIVSTPIFSVRFGMIVVRLQLPVRSP